MSRRKKEISDSLDMLLDTITNTFGGIVFLAMLIVMLMGSAKPETADSTDITELLTLKNEIEEIKQKKVELEQAQTAQQIVSAITGFNGNPDSVKRARQKADKYAQMRDDLAMMLDARLNLSEKLRTSAIESEKLRLKTSVATNEEKDLSQKLAEEIESRKKEIDLPKERLTQKSQTAAIVKSNRIYMLDQNHGSGMFKMNNADFEQCSVKDAVLVLTSGKFRPRNGAGVSLGDVEQVRKTLNQVNASQTFLTVAIWGDSFGQFEQLREVFKELQLEYELILMDPDGKISEAPRSSKPKVQ